MAQNTKLCSLIEVLEVSDLVDGTGYPPKDRKPASFHVNVVFFATLKPASISVNTSRSLSWECILSTIG